MPPSATRALWTSTRTIPLCTAFARSSNPVAASFSRSAIPASTIQVWPSAPRKPRSMANSSLPIPSRSHATCIKARRKALPSSASPSRNTTLTVPCMNFSTPAFAPAWSWTDWRNRPSIIPTTARRSAACLAGPTITRSRPCWWRACASRSNRESSRLDNGYRDFDESAIERVRTIQLYFGLGLNAEQIEGIINCRGKHAVPQSHSLCKELLSLYEDKLREVEEQIAIMDAVRSRLKERIAHFQQMRAEESV